MPIYRCKFIQFLHTEKPNCLIQTSFGTNFCVWNKQVFGLYRLNLQRFHTVVTLYFLSLVYTRFQFIQSFVMQDSSLFKVWLCRIPVYSKFGYAGFQFIQSLVMQDSSLFKVWLCRIPVYSKFGYVGFQFIQGSMYLFTPP